MNPRGVFYLTRLIEVEDEVAGQHVTGIVAHDDGAPGGLTRGLHSTLQTSGIGSQMAHKGIGCRQLTACRCGVGGIGIAASAQLGSQLLGSGIHQFKVHGGIVGTGGLVDVDIQAVVGFHLQRSLYTCLREDGNGRVAPIDSFLHASANLRQLRLLGLLLLGVIVARQPPGGMVASHRKLCTLFLNQEVVEVSLLGELITEPYPIVIDTEADNDGTLVLTRSHTGTTRGAGKAVEPLL